MAETFDLYAQIKRAESNYNAAVAKNKEISQKIERLEQAQKFVRYAHSDAKSVVSEVSGFDMPDKWAGGRKNKFNNKRTGDLLNEAKGYADGIEDLDDAIEKEISNLRSQTNYLVKLISSIDKSLTNLNKQLRQSN